MTNERWGLVLGAVGVVALSVAAWRRMLTQPRSDLPLTRAEWYELFRAAGHIVP